MYSASATFNTKIKSNARKISWSGTITTVGGTTYSLSLANIAQGSITRSISSQSLNIGTAYASSLSMEIILAGVSRYELYGATISLSCSVEGASDVIPMGVYIVTEASQTADHISLKAYDDMVKFDDVVFVPSANTDIQSPYDWLSDSCTACSVTLGNTSAEIKAMPNGKRNVGYADVVADVKTWRDVLGYITALLGGYAYIGRDRKLYIGQYGSVSADTVPSSFRYSSDLSDYKTTYNGIHNIFKEDAVQEYTSNENEDGLILDLGTNPFLQFTKQNNRIKAMQEIIDVWDGLFYVPFKVDMPLVPTYDPGDIISFSDNQATQDDFGAITEITYQLGGTMSITCTGDNPRLADAQDRFSKTVAGLSSDYTNTRNIGNKDFWILSTTNTDAITVGSTEIQIAEIEWQQNTYVQDIEMILLIDADLSATAKVEARLNVDDSTDYEVTVVTDKALKGTRPFHGSNPQKVTGTGTHTAKVYMKVTDTPLLVGDLV